MNISLRGRFRHVELNLEQFVHSLPATLHLQFRQSLLTQTQQRAVALITERNTKERSETVIILHIHTHTQKRWIR